MKHYNIQFIVSYLVCLAVTNMYGVMRCNTLYTLSWFLMNGNKVFLSHSQFKRSRVGWISYHGRENSMLGVKLSCWIRGLMHLLGLIHWRPNDQAELNAIRCVHPVKTSFVIT